LWHELYVLNEEFTKKKKLRFSLSASTLTEMPADQPRVIALIPARGGSVSIPKKNIKPLAGRPLIDWVRCAAPTLTNLSRLTNAFACIRQVIQPALASGVFAEVWVSTDDDAIAASAVACGAKVHRRASETATNTASTESAMVDFVKAHPEYDILCLIQVRSILDTRSYQILFLFQLNPPRKRKGTFSRTRQTSRGEKGERERATHFVARSQCCYCCCSDSWREPDIYIYMHI